MNAPGMMFGLLLWLLASHLSAHPADNSLIQIDIRNTGLRVQLQLPVDQLYMAAPALFPHGKAFDSLQEALPAWSDFDRQAMQVYLKKHLHLFLSADGPDPLNPSALPRVRLAAPLQIQTMDVVVSNHSLQLKVLLHTDFPDPGIRNNRAWRWLVDSDLINHSVRNHKTMVTLGADVLHGRDGRDPVVLGIIGYQSSPLVLTSDPGSTTTLFITLLLQGVMHILEGFDHLLLLICLLLAAPLRNVCQQWQTETNHRQSWRNLLKLVSAFSLGHTLTLTLASLGYIRIPSYWVEMIVAASLLLSAAYLLKPWRRLPITGITTLFGLVHGLAFASELGNDGFSISQQLIMLGGFAAGIELAQIGICLLVMPSLLELARYRPGHYRYWRLGGASLTLLLALLWLLERSVGSRVIPVSWQDYLPMLLIVLYLLVLGCSLYSLIKRPLTHQATS